MTVQDIAAVCHEANKAYCESIGDKTQLTWMDAPDWQKASAVKGVEFHIAQPEVEPYAQHENWMKDKLADGWKFGDVKDEKAKTHPCLRPWRELPQEQQAKDRLFKAVCGALMPLLEAE